MRQIYNAREKRIGTIKNATITYYLQKNSSSEGEKSEEWRGKKLSSEQVRGIFLVAGVGFFIALPSRIVKMRAKHSFASFLLALWGIAS